MSSKPTALDKVINDPTEHQYDDAIKAAARRELSVQRELCNIIMELQDGPGSECAPNSDETERFIKAMDAYRQWRAEQDQQS